MSGVTLREVKSDEDGMRLGRWFKEQFPTLPFGRVQKLLRTGQIRVDGARVKTSTRLGAGQTVRIPPIEDEPKADRRPQQNSQDADFLKGLILYEDDDLMVLNKPAGLAVQGGSGTTRHIDGMLASLGASEEKRPRLVHRLDRDTAGCLVIAKRRKIAADLGRVFRSRSARKVYWALVVGLPRPMQGRVSSFLARGEGPDTERMRVVDHGEEGGSHAVTYYAVVEKAGKQVAWLSLKPVTGRTHQLRAHMEQIGHPIVGDPKYGENLPDDFPSGLPGKLHLLARRIVLPHPGGGRIDVTAPLPDHMRRSWELLGFDVTMYDPIEESPED